MKEFELIEKRTPKEKHFLQKDGTVVAKIYATGYANIRQIIVVVRAMARLYTSVPILLLLVKKLTKLANETLPSTSVNP